MREAQEDLGGMVMKVSVAVAGMPGVSFSGGKMEFDGTTVDDLLECISATEERVHTARAVIGVFVNGAPPVSGGETTLVDGDEVMLVVPVCGG